ncbi:CHAT domain-containing protein/tetratricopeptide (TPR) repeat protein [Bradyrhizobium sp. CIR48]|uniref:CHAT domain-containing tetratricopeptide repeat protein n=1 Tax=Bradyrhizobium sp. CIR48 TaxID=2663840 RepID=UPI001606E0E2|nr:CHAT domain-containing tetratricopeptide repeat protein [Bradyrhizobium sp. CIR48]MBB4422982.1 CHAT domain-containing protein/tetratricopeptide (TPR) repeat protein [Bradyrhizobium sp. CIR48]
MLALMQRITALAKEGRSGEAVGFARKLVVEAEKSTGRQSPLTATTLVVLGQALQTKGETAEAESVLRRALVIREKSLGPNHPDVAAVLATLGQIELGQNRLGDAERDMSRAIAIDESVLGPDHLTTALARMQLGNLRHRQMKETEALDLFNRALVVFRKSPEQADIMIPVTLNNIAEVNRAQGRLQQAEASFADALVLQEKQHGPDSIYLTATLNNLGELRRAQGRLPEAEQLARRTLAIREKALGPDHPDVAASLNNLALVFSREGRDAEAEGLLTRALAIQEKAVGIAHPNVATALNNLAEAWAHLNRKQEAEQLFRKSLAIREKALGPAHLDVAIALDNLVTLMSEADRYAEAEPFARRSLAIREAAVGHSHPLVANSLNNLAVILDSTGRPQEAEPLLKRALDIRLRALGEQHPDVANSFANLGAHHIDLKDWQQARDAFARAVAIQNGRRAAEQESRGDVKVHEETNPYPGLIVAAYNLANANAGQAGALRSQGFEAAQWIGDEQAARAIAGMSARIADGSGDLAARVRERQDLAAQAVATDKMLVAAISQADAARNPAAEQALRARASTIAGQIRELDRTIAAQFPDYAALVTKAPIAIEDAQKQLRPNEAMLLFTTTSRATFVWTVTRSDVRWHSADLGEKQLDEAVGALRCGLDTDAWLDKATTCPQKLGRKTPLGADEPLPFDQERAFALYQALLGPVARDIDGKELILVPSGPLATLPFQVLLTEKPAAGQDLAKASWLVKRFATTVLPSVSSLKALRQVARKSAASKPFLGVGNPVLDGDGRSDVAMARAKLARQIQTCAALPTQATQVAQRSLRAVDALSGGTADIVQLRRQMPLPETALELCAVASTFVPVKGDVALAGDASETRMKALGQSGDLAKYRILHFATHGALAGQVRGSIEPGLILSPPAAPTPTDDGYLSSSEISGLKLDADWVILSACNTAGGQAANSEAFSGLARAFFYAGTRALLVSHWAVNSDAAVAITTGTIDAMKTHPDIGRAEALRRSLSALITKGGDSAQPATWAPFVLVGAGAM